GDEVLHLPTIVEACVASPQAAAASANQIRKYLSKDYSAQPSTQYNAIMLIRILADNPGQSFTKNMDKPFVQTVKEMLRTGKDPSVQQLLRETLYSLDSQKAYDTNMALLFTMWRRESSMMSPRSYGPRTLNAPSWDPNQAPLPPSQHPSESYSRNNSHRRERGLPPATELAARIEEARTSAKILDQRVDIVDKSEIMGDELVKEFADRCQAAQRSIQGYINADNPPADDDTLQTLIETNDKLSHSQSKYQHKILQGRRHLGVSSVTPSPPV
ncbi:GAT-like domain-containing protein, partial [Patellaria atrata CBS 101060]